MKAMPAPAATECVLEAVQILLGGNVDMVREFRVEQLARRQTLQIGGGTYEIQQITCARALLRRRHGPG